MVHRLHFYNLSGEIKRRINYGWVFTSRKICSLMCEIMHLCLHICTCVL